MLQLVKGWAIFELKWLSYYSLHIGLYYLYNLEEPHAFWAIIAYSVLTSEPHVLHCMHIAIYMQWYHSTHAISQVAGNLLQ